MRFFLTYSKWRADHPAFVEVICGWQEKSVESGADAGTVFDQLHYNTGCLRQFGNRD